MIKLSNKEELRQMIARYIRGKASDEEITFLKKYYDHFEDQNNGLDELTRRERALLRSEIFNGLQEKMVQQKENQSKIVWIYRAVAAVAAILIAAGVFWYINQTGDMAERLTVEKSIDPYQTEMAGDLKKHLYLPDGSYVVLEPGSELRYLRDFTGYTREVELDGRAFFDVQHDESHPFVVECAGVRTRVLGTAFTISSYDDSQEFSISVTRGKVEVSDETRQLEVLEKDDQLILDRDTREYIKNRLDTKETAELEPEYYMMDDIMVGEAIHIMEKRWNCEFEVENPALINCRFTTSFRRTDNLDEVVAVMATVTGAEYSIKDKVVSLRGNGCKE